MHEIAVGCPVLAAGVGVRQGGSWVLRAASFRLATPAAGGAAVGIATTRQAAGSAVVSLLAGHAKPAYGELRVLGRDLTTPVGRAAVRHRVGVARRARWARPRLRVRGLVEHAARLAGLRAAHTELLTAAILDRLGLTAWAEVPLWSAPAVVSRRARLAAAAVHEPDLLLLDGLLDGLGPGETTALAGYVRDLARDAAVVATGRDSAALGLACDQVLTLTDGVLMGV